MLLDVTEGLLEERRRLGIDKMDERWAGEWHIVNPPKHWHGLLNVELLLVLAPLAKERGLQPCGDAHGLFAADDDWRVPAQSFSKGETYGDAGLAGAELVVEIRSPGDESYAKLPFYAGRGVKEVLVVHEDRTVELYRLRADGQLVRVETEEGGVRSEVLGVALTKVDGPRLRVAWTGGSAEI